MSDFYLEMLNITKRFPNVLALDNVDFKVRKGEIHALLGENGAGKTTLMKVLCGLYSPDSGKISVDGIEAKIASPKDAIALGISMVHQKFLLVDSLNVCENIGLGTRMRPFFPERTLRDDVKDLMTRYALDVDLDAKVWQIPTSEQQKVEILKAMYRGAKILILDEPTSMIAPSDCQGLFTSLRELSNSGTTIVFITHKMKEALSISNSITVMRRGRVVASRSSNQVSPQELASLVIGGEIAPVSYTKQTPSSDRSPLLEVRDLHVESDRGLMAVKGVTFSLLKAEILGIAGASGNGQSELMETLVGMRRAKGGSVLMGGKELTRMSPGQIRDLGVAYLPESKKVGVSPGLSVAENAILKVYSDKIGGRVMLHHESVESYAKGVIDEFNIATPSLDMPVKFLSGGNVQKVMLGRELISNPKVLVAGNPTAGLDISTTEIAHRLFIEARDRGTGIILFSEDIDEILSLSDRIAVIYEGEIRRIFDGAPPLQDLSLAMTGA